MKAKRPRDFIDWVRQEVERREVDLSLFWEDFPWEKDGHTPIIQSPKAAMIRNRVGMLLRHPLFFRPEELEKNGYPSEEIVKVQKAAENQVGESARRISDLYEELKKVFRRQKIMGTAEKEPENQARE